MICDESGDGRRSFWKKNVLTHQGGLRFYDRAEVKTVLDYLRVIDQPGNNDALARILNVPARGIGEATVKALLEEADDSRITLWKLVLDTAQGNRLSKTTLRKQAEKGLSNFINIILTARKKLIDAANRDDKIVESIKVVLEKTNYEEWHERRRRRSLGQQDSPTTSSKQGVVLRNLDFVATKPTILDASRTKYHQTYKGSCLLIAFCLNPPHQVSLSFSLKSSSERATMHLPRILNTWIAKIRLPLRCYWL